MRIAKSIATAFAAALMLGATGVEAKTVSLSKQDAGSYYGSENWKTGITQVVQDRGAPVGQTYYGTAGAFRFTDGVNAFISFCIDPYSYLDLSEVFTVTEDASVSANIDKLFNAAYGDVKDAVSASAFQVALWEILSETSSTLDAMVGNHYVMQADIAAQANEYLSRLATAETGKYRYTIYSNSGQDQISASPVPLPASALLLIAGLGGMAALRRKQG